MNFKTLAALALATMSTVSADKVVSLTSAQWGDASASKTCTTAPDGVIAWQESLIGRSCSAAIPAQGSTCTTDNTSGDASLFGCYSTDPGTFQVPSTSDASVPYLTLGFTNNTSSTCSMAASKAIIAYKMDTCVQKKILIDSKQKTVSVYNADGCTGGVSASETWDNLFPTCQVMDTTCGSNACLMRRNVVEMLNDWVVPPYLVGVASQKPATSDGSAVRVGLTALSVAAVTFLVQVFV